MNLQLALNEFLVHFTNKIKKIEKIHSLLIKFINSISILIFHLKLIHIVLYFLKRNPKIRFKKYNLRVKGCCKYFIL